jgi:hypothetical protein
MPGLSTALQKELFLESVREKIALFYSYGDVRPTARDELGQQLTGFIQAGVLIKLIRHEAIQDIIDTEHHKAFGISLKQRKLQQKLTNTPEQFDWDLYDLPPGLRKNPKNQ